MKTAAASSPSSFAKSKSRSPDPRVLPLMLASALTLSLTGAWSSLHIVYTLHFFFSIIYIEARLYFQEKSHLCSLAKHTYFKRRSRAICLRRCFQNYFSQKQNYFSRKKIFSKSKNVFWNRKKYFSERDGRLRSGDFFFANIFDF